MTCPKCGSSAVVDRGQGQRRKLFYAQCLDCREMVKSETPFEGISRVRVSESMVMFRPVEHEPAPKRDAMTSFHRETVATEVKKTILTRRQLERENANDPKLKQLGGDR